MWRATFEFADWCLQNNTISIHALRVEGDRFISMLAYWPVLFLSTPSVWRATGCPQACSTACADFYPRPPCGGRLSLRLFRLVIQNFYPRPPCGGRPLPLYFSAAYPYFYPRPPCGGRRCFYQQVEPFPKISIHALRVEGDMTTRAEFLPAPDFYPRPPCGGRREPPVKS